MLGTASPRSTRKSGTAHAIRSSLRLHGQTTPLIKSLDNNRYNNGNGLVGYVRQLEVPELDSSLSANYDSAANDCEEDGNAIPQGRTHTLLHSASMPHLPSHIGRQQGEATDIADYVQQSRLLANDEYDGITDTEVIRSSSVSSPTAVYMGLDKISRIPADAAPATITAAGEADEEYNSQNNLSSAGISGLHQKLTRRLSRSSRMGRRNRRNSHRRNSCIDQNNKPEDYLNIPEAGNAESVCRKSLAKSRPKSLPDLYKANIATLPTLHSEEDCTGGRFVDSLSKELSWLAIDDDDDIPDTTVHQWPTTENFSPAVNTLGCAASLTAHSEDIPDQHLSGFDMVPGDFASWSDSSAQSEILLRRAEPSSSSISSESSLMTLSETESNSAHDINTGNAGQSLSESSMAIGSDDVASYDDFMYLTACHLQTANSGKHDLVSEVDKNAPPPTGKYEEVRRWWPRRVLPAQNMQYMPKLSAMLHGYRNHISRIDKNRMLSTQNVYNCDECVSNGESYVSLSGRPVDEAIAAGQHCSNRSCQYHSNDSSAEDWGISGRSLSENDVVQGGRHQVDYWGILSRCSTRPTSSLALSSLKEMVRTYSRVGQSSCTDGEECNGNRQSYDLRVSSDSDTNASTASNSSEDICLAASSAYLSLRKRRLLSSPQMQRNNGQGCKQKQKRVLSEPMQYILYNSYLRYYGRPGEP
ncbi:hypothetical protein H4R24_005578 [Coemansia sp. RSA 988]|nr:hypothetical protein H4R24_005578 [Coemansia sp. RSA 988]